MKESVIPLKEKRIATHLTVLAMTGARERIAARLTAYDGRVISAISQKPLKFRLNVIIFAIYNDNFNNFITKVLNV